MDTPTSPAPASPHGQTLDTCLSQLAAGTFAFGHLAAFSDLSREKVARISRIWLQIDHAVRRRLIGEAVELAEENVEYQFNRLLRFALSDPEADVRQVAISGLWEDETRSLLSEMLELATDDPSEDVRAAAVAYLGDSIERLIDDDSDRDLLDRIEALAIEMAGNEGQAALIRRRAIEAVGALEQSDETRELIQEAFEYGDPTLEAGALLAMGRSMEERWRPVVLAAIESDDPELRFEAVRALRLIGTTDDVEEIAALTLDHDSDVRRAAVEAIGEIGGNGAVRILRKIAEQTDLVPPEIVEEAIDNALLSVDPLRASG